MRKLILLLLLIASPAWAGGVISGAVLSGCSTGGGAACSTPAGDIFSEGFETPGAEETWTGVDSDAGELTWNSDISGLTTGMDTTRNCTYGLKVNVSNDAGYARLDMGGTKANLYVEYSIYVQDGSTIGAGQFTGIFKACNASNETAAGCHNATQLNYTTSGGAKTRLLAPDASTLYTILDDKWYYIREYIADANAACKFEVGTTYGGKEIADLTYTCKDVSADPQYVFIGSMTGTRTVEFYYGYVSGDDDGTF